MELAPAWMVFRTHIVPCSPTGAAHLLWAGEPCRGSCGQLPSHPIPSHPLSCQRCARAPAQFKEKMSNFSQSCPRQPWSWLLLWLMEEEVSKSLWMPPGSLEPGSEFSPAHYNCSKTQPESSHHSEKSFHMFPCKNSLFMRDAVPCPRVSAPHLSKMLPEILESQNPQSAEANVSVHMP